MSRSYKVRNDFVIVKVTTTNVVGNIRVSDNAQEGKVYTIVAFGPRVENMAVGDRVTLWADQNTVFFQIPGERDLVIIKEANISSVIRDGEE